MSQMGMSMNMTSLGSAKPFDRAFIDMMIPHLPGRRAHGSPNWPRPRTPSPATSVGRRRSPFRIECSCARGLRYDTQPAARVGSRMQPGFGLQGSANQSRRTASRRYSGPARAGTDRHQVPDGVTGVLSSAARGRAVCVAAEATLDFVRMMARPQRRSGGTLMRRPNPRVFERWCGPMRASATADEVYFDAPA